MIFRWTGPKDAVVRFHGTYRERPLEQRRTSGGRHPNRRSPSRVKIIRFWHIATLAEWPFPRNRCRPNS
jgi:hypothetical protein